MLNNVIEKAAIKKVVAVIILLGALVTFLFITLDKPNHNLNQPEDLYFFKIQDSFDMEENNTIADLIQQEDSIVNLHDFNKDLHDQLNYIEVIQQPIEYVGEYNLPLDFVNGYLRSNGELDLSNQKVSIHNKEANITPLNAIQMDFSAYEYFNLDVQYGRKLIYNDFKFSDQLPIILGNNYRTFYNIDDVLEFYHIGRKVEAKVVGFLPENCNINCFQKINLDNYILMPFYLEINPEQLIDYEYITERDTPSSAQAYVKFLYIQKNCGYVVSNDLNEFARISEKIEQLSSAYNLPYNAFNYYENV